MQTDRICTVNVRLKRKCPPVPITYYSSYCCGIFTQSLVLINPNGLNWQDIMTFPKIACACLYGARRKITGDEIIKKKRS